MTTKTNSGQAPATPQAPEGITIVSSQLRSTNLERDVRATGLGPIHVGVRVQDMLERVSAALEDSTRMRAWSLTGPYGTGKSTTALLIDALLGRDVGRRVEADALLTEASPTLAHRLINARQLRASGGLITAVATARREPLFDTVARALRHGAERAWPPRRAPKPITAALNALDDTDAGSGEVMAAVKALCAEAPVALIIDEFGKTLEHLAARGEFPETQDDVFLLQELAEAGAGTRGLPLYILTLQHLSFGDYASRSTSLQTREWAKVQGRFEDITMSTHLGDAVHLIRQTLNHSGLTAGGHKLVAQHAAAASEAWATRGLEGVVPADTELFAAIYPLHPLAVVVAPLLAGQIGQHDRSLTGFLAGDEPHTVRRYLAEHGRKRATRATTIRLADVYDYFLGSGRTTMLASANAARWIEIDTRISEANGLPVADQEVLKTIGLLNLVDSSGALRASLDMVLFALTDPADTADPAARRQLLNRINALCDGGFLVHRGFSDEYRVWQGSAVHLGAQIEALIERCDDHTAVTVVSRYLPPAVVAGKHSQRTGMLRHFETRATDAETGRLTGCRLGDPADGILVFHFGDESNLPVIDSPLPGVVGVSADATSVLIAARYVHALEELSYNDDLDAVARRELTERLAQANAVLATRLAAAFAPNQFAAKWYLLHTGDDASTASRADARPLPARSLAGIVSAACEAVYPRTPEIRNEMLGRHQLTSQGAKARRELMAAMLANPAKQHLGIEGYGPDRAMYSGVLEYLGLHRPVANPAKVDDDLVPHAYTEQQAGSSLGPAWAALWQTLGAASGPVPLDQVFTELMAPPYGVKAGVVPVIVLAALIVGEQDLALFEDGTYQPRLTDALVERMVKAPDHFAVNAMGAQTGARKTIVTEVAHQLGTGVPTAPRPGVRNAALLAVTRELLDRARVLTPYAQRTQEISAQAAAVRSAFANAREPDTMLFHDLPTALGSAPISARGRLDKEAAHDYAVSLAATLDEIAAIDQRLRDRVVKAMAEAFRLPDDLPSLRHDLAAHTRGLLDATLIEPRLRGLITVTHDASLSDEEWLDPVVVRIAGRGMSDWRDSDAGAFAQQAKALAKTLDRVRHLYQTARIEDAADPFTAHVLTLTGSDGREEHALVHVPHAVRDAAHAIAMKALSQARQELGAQGERILLALLAETLIGGPPIEATTAEPARRRIGKKVAS